MGVAKDKRNRKAAAALKAQEAEAGSTDDPVVAVWFRTKSGGMLQFDLVNGKDVDRVMALMLPVAKPEPFRFSQIFDFFVDALTFMWLLRLMWSSIGVAIFTVLHIIGFILYALFNGAKKSPNALLRGLRRFTISLKWAFWRKFVSVRIGKKWDRTVGQKLVAERQAQRDTATTTEQPKPRRRRAA